MWQKDDRIRKSPLKFCDYYYSEFEGDCQAAIIRKGGYNLMIYVGIDIAKHNHTDKEIQIFAYFILDFS